MYYRVEVEADTLWFFIRGPEHGIEPRPSWSGLFREILDCGVGANDGGVLDHTGGYELLLVFFIAVTVHFGGEHVGAFDFTPGGKEDFNFGACYFLILPFPFLLLWPADFDGTI